MNIWNVYELREEFGDFEMPTILSYLFAAAKAMIPVLIVYCLSIGQRSAAILLGLLQILNFSIDGSKSVLLTLILAFVGYATYRKSRMAWLPWVLSGINILSIVENIALESYYILGLLVRRALFVPAVLNYYYYDFFTSNNSDYFRQGFLRIFGAVSQYQDKIPNIIGTVYYNAPLMGANNGLFSDAYANLGSAGVIVMPFLIVLACRLLEACANGISQRVTFMACITSALNFISSYYFTVLLTHGFLSVCILLYFLPRLASNAPGKRAAYLEGKRRISNDYYDARHTCLHTMGCIRKYIRPWLVL
ncbi:MAG: hypothetical protein ACM3X4_02640 [Ignavibacteriales bacterium]